MHDLIAAKEILAQIISQAKKNKLNKVTSAKIELGHIADHGEEITKDNLEFNLKMLSKNTLAENLALDIREVKGRDTKLKEIQGE